MSKALGFRIILANTISLVFFFVAFGSGGNPDVSFSVPENESYKPDVVKISGWSPPSTGIEWIDWLLAFYYAFSFGIAIWLIANPLS